MRNHLSSKSARLIPVALLLIGFWQLEALVPSHFGRPQQTHLSMSSVSTQSRNKAPARYADNAEGVLYVNEACINCQACHRFAPTVFEMDETRQSHHRVRKQPNLADHEEMDQARAALSACPVAAIRVDHSLAKDELTQQLARELTLNEKVSGWSHPFPRAVVDGGYSNVYHVGHHNEHSFGGVPYLVKGHSDSVLVDAPKFSKSAVRTVESIVGTNGPSYMFLTHVDDTADHEKWAEHYPNMKRIFHSGDLGPGNWRRDKELENCEVILHGTSTEESFKAWTLNGKELEDIGQEEFLVLHTPGHSRGSISLYYRPTEGGVLFTGDTLGWSGRTETLTGFPRYGRDLKLQAKTLENFLKLPGRWDLIAPGHGQPRYYNQDLETRNKEVQLASKDLLQYSRK